MEGTVEEEEIEEVQARLGVLQSRNERRVEPKTPPHQRWSIQECLHRHGQPHRRKLTGEESEL